MIARLLIAFWLVFVAGACTDEASTIETLEAAGFTNIATHGWAPGMCGREDMTSTKFTATNPLGKVASGVVCCGALWKGCTIRY